MGICHRAFSLSQAQYRVEWLTPSLQIFRAIEEDKNYVKEQAEEEEEIVEEVVSLVAVEKGTEATAAANYFLPRSGKWKFCHVSNTIHAKSSLIVFFPAFKIYCRIIYLK